MNAGNSTIIIRIDSAIKMLACMVWLAAIAFCGVRGTNAKAAENDVIPHNIVVLHNLRYREGPNKNWELDLAMQKDCTGNSRPAIVVIHGGGWLEGDKSSFSTPKNRPPGNIIDFARLGFVAVTINYRLSKECRSRPPSTIANVPFAGCVLTRKKYQVDPDLIGAWGNSAGGHLCCCSEWLTRTPILKETARIRNTPAMCNPWLVTVAPSTFATSTRTTNTASPILVSS